MKHFFPFLLLFFISSVTFSQTLSPGDLAIIGLGVDDENILVVALEDIPSGESVFFTDEEWNGTSFNTGEGFYEWITPVITAGTVFEITTSSTTIGGTVSHNSGSFALGNSGDGVFLYQTSANVYNSGTYTLIGFAGEDSGDAGTLTGTGLSIGSSAIYYGGDNGIYVGTRIGQDKNTYLSLIYGSSWTTSGSSQTYDFTNFTFSGDSNDSDSEADDPGSQPAATTVSSLDDTIAEAVDVFSIDLYDYGTTDGLDTEVTKLRLYPYTTNTADWTDNIQGVTVSDGSAITISSVIIDDTFIDINFTSGDLTIPDGDILQVTVSIYLNTSNITDGEIISFMVDADNHGFVADVAGSTFASSFSGGDFNSNDFTIDVEATQLTYLAQATDVEINTIMSPSVEIAYTDANGNIDVDYSGSGFDIAITSDGSLDGTATTTAEATNGIAIFSNVLFDTVATDIKLSATDNSAFISGVFESDLFDVTSVSAATGNIMITEIMQNPADVGDTDGEYFEVYNTTNTPIDMNGWTISDNDSDSHTISSSLIVPAFGFAVLGTNSDPLTNGGVTVDYEYSGIALANGDDEVILTDETSTEIDRVEYDGGTNWPDPTGASMVYLGSDIEDNNDGTLWGTATIAEGIDTDFGSPGINGEDQIVAYLVFDNNAWSSAPTASTGTRTGLIRSDESTSFTTDITLDILYIEDGADLTITSGNELTINSLILESTSNSYSSLISDGIITGDVTYKRHVNTFNSTTGSTNGQNDLISAPVTNASQDFGTFRSINTNIPSGTVSGGTTTFYLFGPYDNNAASNPYTLFSDADDATIITAGTGYRTASTNTSTFTFTGDVLTGTVPVTITTGTENSWNLIGNPYSSYINSTDFLNENSAILDSEYLAIYGYDGDAANGWTVVNLANDINLTPGQGFMVFTDELSATVNFTPTMRRLTGGDDFIEGRSQETNVHFGLKIQNSTSSYGTDFYFNNSATSSLDPGYDSAIFSVQLPDLYMYSHLVENNTGRALAIQSLNDTDLTDITIPLGVHTNALEQITFSIDESTLPSNVDVYLEDNAENTFTLLTAGDYTITPNTNLNGTGRFYLRFTTTALSVIDTTLNSINIYNNTNDKTIVVAGELIEETIAKLYDIQGRLVSTTVLNSNYQTQSIAVDHLNTGVYIIELNNTKQNKKQKLILR
ncbi:lamin tail domain-containing protein [Winogradskyella endarachnes]|uniref:T9SS type A sorting domain-containing protein n=1 Tax=Winogradskyella endarachnes TaxID=2681965 RepID=A0A6L6U8L2_9FLAO|nr:lamin tail domain-containing protein [Winogradskyella endarachnes]MUU77856.1 T9SS type A sorting domain-containing protein [Winogradskyella endarachnes]